MYFANILTALSVATLLASANAGLIQARGMTAQEIVQNLASITVKSQDLQVTANSINLINMLLPNGPYQQIIAGYNDIGQDVSGFISNMPGTPILSLKADEDAVINALRNFVLVHQALLNILIGKSGLLQQIIVGPPVAAALRGLEAVVDAFANYLIGLFETEANIALQEFSALQGTFTLCINAYTLA